MNLNPISNPGLLCAGLLIALVIAWVISLVATLNKGRAVARRHREWMGPALAEVRIDEMTAKNFRLYIMSVCMAVDNRLRLGYDEAMVITNSTFGDAARQLAAAENCTFIDRDGLAEWILQMQLGRPQRDLRGY